MRRPSAFALFCACVAMGLVGVEWFVERADQLAYYRDTFDARSKSLVDEGDYASRYVQATRDLEGLSAMLQTRVRLKAVSFWAIYHGHEVYRTNLDSAELANMKFTPGDGTFGVRLPQYSYVMRPLRDGFSVVVGLRYSEEEALKDWLELDRGYSLVYLAALMAVAGLAFSFVFRDFAAAARRLMGREDGALAFDRARSVEAEVLARGISAHEDLSEALARERDALRRQVLPSLRAELSSGRTPPYEFDCVLVRTDVNNFSETFNSRPKEEFLATIDGFFLELSRIVARYGGLMHEFVGDEAIYYFKDEEVGDSVAAALSAVHEANLAAARIDAAVRPERGYSFTVKSALAHGRVRYGKFLKGYNLAGSVLIESVRALAQVREKDGNVVVFDDRHEERARAVARTEPYRDAELKGFSGVRRLVAAVARRDVADAIAARDPAIRHFRSDSELASVLLAARDRAETGRTEDAAWLFDALRSCPLPARSPSVRDALTDWILASLAAARDARADGWVLAPLVALARGLVHPSVADEALKAALERAAAEAREDRVVANSIESLAAFDARRAAELASRSSRSGSPRLEAACLLARAATGFDRSTARDLRRMLDSKDPMRAASGAYAAGELAARMRETDAVRMRADRAIWSLVEKLPGLIEAGPFSVSLQATRAARKTGDGRAIAAARDAVSRVRDEGARAALAKELSAPATARGLVDDDESEARANVARSKAA